MILSIRVISCGDMYTYLFAMPRLDWRGVTCAYLPMRQEMSGSRSKAVPYCCMIIMSMLMLLSLAVVDVYALMAEHRLANDFVNTGLICT